MAKTGRPPTCICGKCQKCKHRIASRERYQALSMEERRELMARRDPDATRRADRRRYWRDRDKRQALQTELRRRNPERYAERSNRWAEQNPEKRKAQHAVNNAVRDGRLKKQPCEVCGQAKVQAHHDNYSRPLDVRWLCTFHHGVEHTVYREDREAMAA